MSSEAWDEITHSFPNINRRIADVFERITNLIPYIIMDVIT